MVRYYAEARHRSRELVTVAFRGDQRQPETGLRLVSITFHPISRRMAQCRSLLQPPASSSKKPHLDTYATPSRAAWSSPGTRKHQHNAKFLVDY